MDPFGLKDELTAQRQESDAASGQSETVTVVAAVMTSPNSCLRVTIVYKTKDL